MDNQMIIDSELHEEICGYARISFDVEKEDDENTSIENQINIIHNYVSSHFPKCHLTEYKDRDRSGYTFEQRENYQLMRKELMSGKSRILIVKDFSRFARRNSLGLYELEQLRDAGVRIISIMDGIDYPTHDEWLMIQFRFLTNELPVTDTSKKVRKVIENSQKNGEWLCSVPYGFTITNQKKHLFEIVPDEAEVIKEVFRLYNEGFGYKKISNYLTEKHIPTPRTKVKERIEEKGDTTKLKANTSWSIATIRDILTNDFYIGTLRQHKYTRTKINGSDKRLPENEHIVFKKHHPAIIDDKVFLYTQEQLKLRTKSNYRGTKKYNTSYSGYLFCGDCGSPMFSMSRPDLPPAYTCGTYHKRGLKGCSSHHTRIDFLDKVLKDYIKLVKNNSQHMIEELEKSILNEVDSVKNNDRVIKMLEKQLDKSKEELKATKKQKIRDISRNPEDAELYEEMYSEMENELTLKIYGLQEQIKLNMDKRNDVIEINRTAKTVFDVFNNILNKETLSKVDIGLIVDKIVVYENNIIKINLKSDIEHLLNVGTLPNEEDTSENFYYDSISISNDISTKYTHQSVNQQVKAYTVNVINGGSPLCITLTENEKYIIFKNAFMNFASNSDKQSKNRT